MDHIFTGSNWSLINARLRSRLVLFLVIAIGLVAFSIYEVVIGDVSWSVTLIAFLLGGVIGVIYGRLVRVHWDESESKIVTRMDTIGFIIIVAYVVLAYFRESLLAHFFAGAALTDVGLTLAGGLLIGRFFGMHISLMKTIRAHRSTPAM